MRKVKGKPNNETENNKTNNKQSSSKQSSSKYTPSTQINLVRSSIKGFTLIEMLVVLSLLGVLVSGAFTSYVSLEKAQLKWAAEEAKAFIEETKEMAAISHQAYRITCDVEEGVYCLEEIQGVEESRTYRLPKGIEAGIGTQSNPPLPSATLPNSTFFAFQKGMSPSSSGTLWLRQERTGALMEITLRPVTGKLTIYKG